MYVKHNFPTFGFYNMLVGGGLLILAGVLIGISPYSAIFTATAGGSYLYLGYRLRKVPSRRIVLVTALVYAVQVVYFAYGPLFYEVRMSPGILVGIQPGGLNLSLEAAFKVTYYSAGDSPLVLGFDLLALVILIYLADQYRFVPERTDRPPEDILDVDV